MGNCKGCSHPANDHRFPDICISCPDGICEAGGDFSEDIVPSPYSQMITRAPGHDPLVAEPNE